MENSKGVAHTILGLRGLIRRDYFLQSPNELDRQTDSYVYCFTCHSNKLLPCKTNPNKCGFMPIIKYIIMLRENHKVNQQPVNLSRHMDLP